MRRRCSGPRHLSCTWERANGVVAGAAGSNQPEGVALARTIPALRRGSGTCPDPLDGDLRQRRPARSLGRRLARAELRKRVTRFVTRRADLQFGRAFPRRRAGSALGRAVAGPVSGLAAGGRADPAEGDRVQPRLRGAAKDSRLRQLRDDPALRHAGDPRRKAVNEPTDGVRTRTRRSRGPSPDCSA